MGIQQSINNISKLGYSLSIDIDDQGYIVAGIYHKPDVMGMTASVLNPTNETGNNLSDILKALVKRLEKQIKEQGNE